MFTLTKNKNANILYKAPAGTTEVLMIQSKQKVCFFFFFSSGLVHQHGAVLNIDPDVVAKLPITAQFRTNKPRGGEQSK